MSINCEADLQNFILKNYSKDRYHICQVESPLINPGVFDLNLADTNGKEHWIELKWHSDKSSISPNIRISQIRWAEKRLKFNGSLWLLTGAHDCVMMHHANMMRNLTHQSWEEWSNISVWSVPIEQFQQEFEELIRDEIDI